MPPRPWQSQRPKGIWRFSKQGTTGPLARPSPRWQRIDGIVKGLSFTTPGEQTLALPFAIPGYALSTSDFTGCGTLSRHVATAMKTGG